MTLLEIREYAINSDNNNLLVLANKAMLFWPSQSQATFSRRKNDVIKYMDVQKIGKYYLAIISV
jgi:hypothetical protein